MTWLAIGLSIAGAYLLKLAGLSLPARVVEQPTVRRAALLAPVALLTALVVVQTFGVDGRLVVDARFAGLVAGALAVLVRAPFIVVVVVAAATAAIVRQLA